VPRVRVAAHDYHLALAEKAWTALTEAPDGSSTRTTTTSSHSSEPKKSRTLCTAVRPYLLARFVKSFHFLSSFFTYPAHIGEFAAF